MTILKLDHVALSSASAGRFAGRQRLRAEVHAQADAIGAITIPAWSSIVRSYWNWSSGSQN